MPTYMQVITGVLLIGVVVYFVRADLADSRRARTHRSRTRTGQGSRRGSGPYANHSGFGYYDYGSTSNSDCGSSGGDSGGGGGCD